MPASVVEAASPVDVDARGVVVPVGAGLDIDALAEGEEEGVGPTGADVGVVDVWVGSVGEVTALELEFVVAGVTGPPVADGGVVDVWVGSVGEVTAVELRFVVPGLFGLDVGALSDGEEMGADLTGADVGVVDVWVGPVGDVTGVGDPVGGTEAGCCGEADVGVGAGG
ncbi:MAG TPA: hypothetical protein VK215_09750 [Acidimicrobiales bacterium]|nr:hypothetical protein [Acidimicrobiales bacterium]